MGHMKDKIIYNSIKELVIIVKMPRGVAILEFQPLGEKILKVN